MIEEGPVRLRGERRQKPAGGGIFQQNVKADKASSAGTKPARAVNPMAVKVMKEVGIDISGARP